MVSETKLYKNGMLRLLGFYHTICPINTNYFAISCLSTCEMKFDMPVFMVVKLMVVKVSVFANESPT